MSHTYYLDYQRHTFRADDLSVRPIAPSDAAAEPPPASAAVLHVDAHRGHLSLRRPSTSNNNAAIATAKYPTSSADIEIAAAGNRVTLTHSFVKVDASGRSHENSKPERSFWRRRITDGSRGCYVGTLPDGTRLRWEPAAPKEDPDTVKKVKTRAEKMLPKLRCMLVDGRGTSLEVLGEMMRSNDVVRLARGGGLAGEGGMLGVYVLLGFVSLYERARARNKRKAELELEVDFTFDGDGGGGDGGNGGDGGGGDGGGGS
ncbi:hypothetical protein F5Y13DRAFT_203637 [Hypoxylon sp. FL1857]|nr:hypothetical protein F5Y13DRAFT_203637 [Hypoxylon sp. FL1857]